MKKPVIGVIPDFDSGSKNSYSTRPHYAVRQNYLSMLQESGAAPILLPYDKSSTAQYCDMIDGLMVIGGFFDVDPAEYGEEILNDTVILNKVRSDFEFDFIKNYLDLNKPILGVCNGMQVINTIRGGNLIQDIACEKEDYMIHEQSKVKNKEDASIGYHEVTIQKDSLIYDIIKSEKIITNSSHHQAVRSAGKNLEVSCRTDDGIIEGIEDKSHKFCVGVQWHPEFNVSSADKKLFDHFVKVCQ